MDPVKPLLFGILLPAVVAGLAILAARPWRGALADAPAGGARAGGWGPALGLGLGFAAAYVALLGRPPFPPVQTSQWLPHFAVLAAILGVVETAWRAPLPVRVAIHLAAAGGAAYLTLRPMIASTFTAGQTAAWMAGCGVAIAVVWGALEILADRLSGRLMAVAGFALATGTAGVLAMTGSALLGQLAGVLAATSGAAFVLALARPALHLGGAVPVLALVLGGLWLNGHVYSDTPAHLVGLLAAGPVLGAVASVAVEGRLSPGKANAMRLAATLLPIAAALALAGSALMSEPASEFGRY